MIQRLSEIDIPERLRGVLPPWVSQFGVALCFVALAIAGRLAVDAVTPGVVPFALIFPAILVATLLAGWTSGVMTTVMGGGLVWYFLIEPRGSFAIVHGADGISLVLFAISALLIVTFAEAYRASARTLATVRGRESEQREERFRLVAETAPVNLWMGDETGRCVYLNRSLRQFWGAPEDLVGFEWNATLLEEDRQGLFAVFDEAMRNQAPFEAEARYRRADGEVRFLLTRAEPRRNAEGGFVGMIGVNVDTTEIRRAEAHQRLLLNELNHRVKNTLATVQSIARQTLIEGQSITQAREVLTGRLLAMSAAHDVLTRENWEGADLRDVVAGAIGPYQTELHPRFYVEGPDARLDPRPALAVAMALHELATNAVKYGALSTDAGEILISWANDTDQAVRLEWRERGGPPVSPPTRQGFGSRLLDRGMAIDLGAAAKLSFEPAGVVCVIRAPVAARPA